MRPFKPSYILTVLPQLLPCIWVTLGIMAGTVFFGGLLGTDQQVQGAGGVSPLQQVRGVRQGGKQVKIQFPVNRHRLTSNPF